MENNDKEKTPEKEEETSEKNTKKKEIIKGSRKLKNLNHEMFCQLYSRSGEYFGNGVRSYIVAFKIKGSSSEEYNKLTEKELQKYDSSKVLASKLLTKDNIRDRCNYLIDQLIKDEVVDRELAKVILQDYELNPKVSAIREYNRVKKRVDSDVNLKVPQNLIDLIKSIRKKDE